MKTRNTLGTRPLTLIALAGLLCALAACNVVPPAQDDPTRYFVLSEPAVHPGQAAAASAGARIGLRAVKIESYLRRREMVVRMGENEVQFRDYRRWAEPLESGVARVLRARLLASPDVAQVYTEPFPADQDRDFDVSIDVRRFEGSVNPAGKYSASMSAAIEVSTTGPNAHVVARRVFVAPAAAWDGRDFDQLAGLLTADVSALGQEVLADLPPRG